VAGMVMFGVFGSFAKSTYGDLETVCTADGRCPADRQADIDAGKRDQTIANVSLVVGVSGLIAGTSLFLLEPEIDDSATASVRLEVSPTYLGLGGRF
ncbi:MAG: tetratricopeptide repeat protein, partial [Myxococcales bacterium]|nr:tetratricopeptide repeat protein [Myxococcales bacterium]